MDGEEGDASDTELAPVIGGEGDGRGKGAAFGCGSEEVVSSS